MPKYILYFAAILTLILIPAYPVSAQAAQDYPVYVVQNGDTISSISIRFGISSEELISANNITNPNAISSGMELIIPGLQGIKGKLSTQTVSIGETLETLSYKYQVPIETLIKLNRITSPMEIFAGTNLILPEQDTESQLGMDTSINPDESLLEVAIRRNQNPWTFLQYNNKDRGWEFLPGDVIYNKGSSPDGQNSISPYIKKITITPLPVIQGKALVIKVQTISPLELSGNLSKSTLHFFKNGENEYVAIQGISAVENIGLSELILNGILDGQKVYNLDQALLVTAWNYGEDPPLEVDPTTIDPKFTKPEEDQVGQIMGKFSTQRLWNGAFQFPTDEPCIKSWFGNRRLYNDSLHSFHTGLDLGVCANNLNIYAPAPGKVVFTGLLTIRGNTTIIDHGWGIFSGYFHQKEILVKVGDTVETRQIIGVIGDTGRVTGPHLHWEIRANNIQVNPVDWVENIYP